MNVLDPLDPKSNKFKNKSLKRLYNDFKEIKEDPLNGIGVFPLENNFYEWHANIQSPKDSPFKGTIYHFIIIFPENYPVSPPKVKHKTFIPRVHINGNSTICLDMFNSGWSMAYTIGSILLQLQSYIFSNEVNESMENSKTYNESIENSIEEANNYVCNCGHNMKNNEIHPKIF